LQFLKTLFWVVLAVIIVLFAKANWSDVSMRLWGGLVVDVKLPVLCFAFFLIGFLPALIVYRTRIWALKRRLEPLTRNAATVPPPTATVPSVVSNSAGPEEERVATDTKVWPAE
jgi:uncharacterized integral membrane protein